MPTSRFTNRPKRKIIQIQYVEDLSKDELENQRSTFLEQGWKSVKVKERPDLRKARHITAPGWKAYEWTGIPA